MFDLQLLKKKKESEIPKEKEKTLAEKKKTLFKQRRS